MLMCCCGVHLEVCASSSVLSTGCFHTLFCSINLANIKGLVWLIAITPTLVKSDQSGRFANGVRNTAAVLMHFLHFGQTHQLLLLSLCSPFGSFISGRVPLMPFTCGFSQNKCHLEEHHTGLVLWTDTVHSSSCVHSSRVNRVM